MASIKEKEAKKLTVVKYSGGLPGLKEERGVFGEWPLKKGEKGLIYSMKNSWLAPL